MFKYKQCIFNLLFLLFGLFHFSFSSIEAGELYHTKGSQIVDSNEKQVHFNGLSWFGFETSNFVLHGLWSESMDDILSQIQKNGYNLLRIPYSNEMFSKNSVPTSINYYKNPDLINLTPIEILDKLIEKAKTYGLKIFLDRHRPTSAQQSELWYTNEISEEKWISDWEMLAKRYLHNDIVIGADLHNEPHGQASWGTNNVKTDWRLAAEKAGNAILKINPNWLIIVEGVETNVKDHPGNYWWGGNLSGIKEHPVRLDIPNQLVYSPHDYGPGVSNQPWFNEPIFPANLSDLWNKHWGYIHKENIAPILVGEFGGRNVGMDTPEGIWQNTLVDYLQENDMYWTYWSLNPNSGDTGGLLLDDWKTWNSIKQEMLDRLMK